MINLAERLNTEASVSERSATDKLTPESFASLAGLADLAAILWAAIVARLLYNHLAGAGCVLGRFSLLAWFLVAFFFVACNIFRRNYSLTRYLKLSGHAGTMFAYWNVAVLVVVFLNLVNPTHASTSSIAIATFYGLGASALYITRAAMVRNVQILARHGGLRTAKIMVVGFDAQVARNYAFRQLGKDVVATCLLQDGGPTLAADLSAATRLARSQALDEILIVAPLARAELIDQCVCAFQSLPAAIDVQLWPDHLPSCLSSVRGNALSRLHFRGHSLSEADLVVKRACDIAFASIALIVFMPVMLLTAIAIKLDSPGPVFFLQTRHGLNRKPFRIIKFRSMTAMENGHEIKQATQKDFRVTRMGRFTRKFNIDELPQLVNVLRGEMSLVGPRPHAIAHDRMFEREIALYARRHNLKPGITGWAQVNGLRGPTDVFEKIERRVQYDLHYLDNWNFLLDIWILFLTLFSRTAYRNAF